MEHVKKALQQLTGQNIGIKSLTFKNHLENAFSVSLWTSVKFVCDQYRCYQIPPDFDDGNNSRLKAVRRSQACVRFRYFFVWNYGLRDVNTFSLPITMNGLPLSATGWWARGSRSRCTPASRSSPCARSAYPRDSPAKCWAELKGKKRSVLRILSSHTFESRNFSLATTQCTGLSKRNGAKLRENFCPAAGSHSRPRQADA